MFALSAADKKSTLVKLAYLIIPSEGTPQKEELLDERLLATPAVAQVSIEAAAPAKTATEGITFEDKVKQNEVVNEFSNEARLRAEEEAKRLAEEEEARRLAEEAARLVSIRYKRSFLARYTQSDEELQSNYTVLKNHLLSYRGVKSRLSWSKESYRRGRMPLAKLDVKGNARKCFQKYRKGSVGQKYIREQLENTQENLNYPDTY